MAHDHAHHEDLIDALAQEYQELFDHSEQGIYVYFDDTHKVCNTAFAALLGYDSPDAWAEVDTSFPDAFVADESQATLVAAYQDAMERGEGSTISVTWKRKQGDTVKTTVILVPIVHDGHLFALHFVSP